MSPGFFFGFFAALPFLVAVYWLSVPQKHRPLYLLVLSIAFITVLSPQHALYLSANVLLVYYAGRSIRCSPGQARGILIALIAWLVANLCLLKYGSDWLKSLLPAVLAAGRDKSSWLVHVALPLGFSYAVFRLIHYLVESFRGNVPATTLVQFACYVLFFPTFLAGPVERFRPFLEQTAAGKVPTLDDLNAGLFRIFLGLIRRFIIAGALVRHIFPVLSSPENHAPAFVAVSCYAVILRLYMDFAGYTDLAIGIGRLFGYRLAENFNRPLLQPNIALFWRNWHITVYTWIRDYFFFPLFAYRPSTLKIYLGIFTSIMVFMLWHEASPGYFLAGVYHGVGLTVWSGFQALKGRHAGLRQVMGTQAAKVASIFATLSFVSGGAVLITFGPGGCARIAARLLNW